MAIPLLQFTTSALAIVAAATALTRFADRIAGLTKAGRLLIGSILLAGATSLPELTVDINAVRLGAPDLAVGDLVGSSLFNLLILALIDLSRQSRGQLFSRMAAAHALSGTASIALTALAAISILASRHWAELTFGGASFGCIAILVAYAFAARLMFYDQQISAQQSEGRDKKATTRAGSMTLQKAVVGFSASAAAIVIAGPFMAESAERLAALSGLGDTFVGSTLVAFCTSLPELVATITAVRLGAFDLAIGNIYGSNAFNMVLLLPLDLFFPGSLLAVISPTHAVTCLATILITSVALMGQLYQVESRIRFLEPDALLVIALVLGSLGLVYMLR
jgi:cation:H+ antiporter